MITLQSDRPLHEIVLDALTQASEHYRPEWSFYLDGETWCLEPGTHREHEAICFSGDIFRVHYPDELVGEFVREVMALYKPTWSLRSGHYDEW